MDDAIDSQASEVSNCPCASDFIVKELALKTFEIKFKKGNKSLDRVMKCNKSTRL